jgi:putative acetyltransferase
VNSEVRKQNIDRSRRHRIRSDNTIVSVVPITVRQMQPEDARRFLEIHHAAVRGIAAKDYPTSVVEAWARPITDQVIERFLENSDGEVRLVAEIDGEPAGIGAIVVSNSELRACYVAPSAARLGVGSALVSEIERIAREHHLDHLQLESSITAEPFYSALGYQVESHGEHLLAPNVSMAAVKMRKRLE